MAGSASDLLCSAAGGATAVGCCCGLTQLGLAAKLDAALTAAVVCGSADAPATAAHD